MFVKCIYMYVPIVIINYVRSTTQLFVSEEVAHIYIRLYYMHTYVECSAIVHFEMLVQSC